VTRSSFMEKYRSSWSIFCPRIEPALCSR